MTRHVVVDEVSDGVFADYRHCIHGGAKKLRRLNAWPPLEFGDIQWTEQKERLLRNCILNQIKFEKWVEKFQIREVGELGVCLVSILKLIKTIDVNQKRYSPKLYLSAKNKVRMACAETLRTVGRAGTSTSEEPIKPRQ